MAHVTDGARTARTWAVKLYNDVWTELDRTDRTLADDERMLHMAHASRFHWGEVGGAQECAVGEWQCSRVYAVLGRFEPSLHHAEQCFALSKSDGVDAWVEASAYEAIARAYATGGMPAASRAARNKALELAEAITDDEDRGVVLADIATVPIL